MAVTKKNVNGAFNFTYPIADVFLKERNYFVFEGVEDNTYIKTVKIGDKTLNFGRYLLNIIGEKFYLDVSAYYAKYYGKFNVIITYENNAGDDVTTTVTINATTYDFYDPFKEIVPDRCGDAPYARIVPPNRMLWDGKKETSSLLSAMRDGDYFSGYEYEMDGVPYANFRPSDAWLTTAQKNEHLGETYRNTLPATGNLAELDSNGLLLWIEQGSLSITTNHIGEIFEEQRTNANYICRLKTIFNNYNGLTIGIPSGFVLFVVLYDVNKQYVSYLYNEKEQTTLNNAGTYPYISAIFRKRDSANITPSDLAGITSSILTNPYAGKSWRWYNIKGTYKWQELTQEQLVNNKFYWAVNDKSYSSDIVNNGFTFGSKFSAKLIRSKNIDNPNSWTPLSTIYSIGRSVELVDSAMHYLYARWLTPWCISVEHLFYLDTYATDKDDAQEVESEYIYEERSKHVIKGSFYLDNIRDPYDLWYYQTLANSELVELYLPIFSVRKDIYMPNASDYVAVKITGSNIKDAVVDGVAQSTITFDFEMR